MYKAVRVCVAVVCTLAMVGCGDDDGTTPDAAAAEDQVSDPEASDATTSTEPEGPDGEPLRLMAIADVQGLGESFANLEGGARAAAERINRDGGIDGRPVEVELCDAERNANAAAACARRAVEEGFAAVVRSEEHTSELQSLMRNSYAVF